MVYYVFLTCVLSFASLFSLQDKEQAFTIPDLTNKKTYNLTTDLKNFGEVCNIKFKTLPFEENNFNQSFFTPKTVIPIDSQFCEINILKDFADEYNISINWQEYKKFRDTLLDKWDLYYKNNKKFDDEYFFKTNKFFHIDARFYINPAMFSAWTIPYLYTRFKLNLWPHS